MKYPLSIAVSLLLASSPAFATGAIINHLIFETSSGDKLVGSSSKTFELSIDDAVEVKVDEKALLGDFQISNQTTIGDPLLPRIQLLTQAVEALLKTQESLMAMKSAALGLQTAKGTPGEAEARSAFEAINNTFSDNATTALSPLSESLDTDPELKASLEPAINAAVLDSDYAGMADVLKRYIETTGTELGRRVENGQLLVVYLEATITDNVLHKARVHLDGYDDLRTGDPAPFPRFQIALDERTKEEYSASEKLAQVTNQIRNGTFERQLKDSLQKAQAALQKLSLTLKTDVLEVHLNDTIKTLISAKDEALTPYITELISARDLFADLEKMPIKSDSTQLDALIIYTQAISVKVTQLKAVVNDGPNRLEKLTTTLERLSREKPQAVNKELKQTIAQAKENFIKETGPLQDTYKNLQEIAKAIGVTADLSAATDSMISQPRQLGIGTSLDTRFDLQSIAGWERHPGDRLSITMKVMPKGADIEKGQSLAFGRQQFALQTYGLYMQSRGALLFVDSRTGSIPKQSYEAAPGVAFHFRYGFKNKPFINDWIAPGIGISLAMLDFDDNKNLELGIAGSVTLIKDLFWVGYGRNLQAQADYFFIGINPIALTSLMKLR
jgi:hypothetical protein